MLGGYLLDTSCKAKRMFIFDGSGGNGKSVLIDVFKMFFYAAKLKPQVTALSLSDISGDNFKKSDLITSRVNLCTEEKKGYIDAEEIKKVIDGELISVRGLYKDPITFSPKTKIVIACNGKPTFTDKSDALYRRLVIVKFKNQYKDPEEIKRISMAKERNIYPWDLDLPEKLKLEKSAILNLFLSGLIDLRNNKYQFIQGDDFNKEMADYKRDSDTVREFLEENYEIDFTSERNIQEIYGNYRYWYRNNVQDSSQMKLRANEMGRRIKEVFGLDAIGRKAFKNQETDKFERLSVYNLKEIIIEAPVETVDFGDGPEEITEDKTLGI
jgi:putative DNA primase/helicase